MGHYEDWQREKLDRWKKRYDKFFPTHEKAIEKAFKLLKEKILPILLNSEYCYQSELYKNQSEDVKNVIREVLKSLSSGDKPSLVREKRGSTYILTVKNKIKLKKIKPQPPIFPECRKDWRNDINFILP